MEIGQCTNAHGFYPFLVIAVNHIVGVPDYTRVAAAAPELSITAGSGVLRRDSRIAKDRLSLL